MPAAARHDEAVWRRPEGGETRRASASEHAQFYSWLPEVASRGLRTGKLKKHEIKSVCGAVLELMKRVKIADE